MTRKEENTLTLNCLIRIFDRKITPLDTHSTKNVRFLVFCLKDVLLTVVLLIDERQALIRFLYRPLLYPSTVPIYPDFPTQFRLSNLKQFSNQLFCLMISDEEKRKATTMMTSQFKHTLRESSS
jgi:hypothetical protein